MDAKLIALKAKLTNSGSIMVSLTGTCMEPLLFEGDEALVRPLHPQEDVCVGDICVFKDADGSLASHRVVSVFESKVMLKGDKSNKAEMISRSHIIGTVGSVRLLNRQYWQKIPGGIARRHLSAQLSKRIYHNTAIAHPAPIAKAARLRRRFFRHALMALNQQARSLMVKHPED